MSFYFKNIKESFLTINQVKSLCNKKPIILRFDYELSNGEMEGHYSIITEYKNGKLKLVNNYNIKKAHLIKKENRAKFFKTIYWVDESTFKNHYLNKKYFYIKEL